MSWIGFINEHYTRSEQKDFCRYGSRLEMFVILHEDTALEMVPDEAIDMTNPNTMEMSVNELAIFALDVLIDLAENRLLF